MDSLPEYRVHCLDGCDPTIALQHLCPHTVVSQVVWGDAVAAWADPHDIRLSNDEIEASTTSLDIDHSAHTDEDLLGDLVSNLPQLKCFRGPGSVLQLALETARNIEHFDCTDNQTQELVTTVPTKMPKLQRLTGTQLPSAHLRTTVQRLRCFAGFAWPHARQFRAWLFPAPDQLSQIQLGYLQPREVLDFLSLVPPSMTDVALQKWTHNDWAGREVVFNCDARLPPFLEGFELQDDEPEAQSHQTVVPLQVWRFIEPAARRLKVLILSAPMSPEDLANVTRECNALEELSVSLRFDDDPSAARGLLYSNAGLPRLRRLSLHVVGDTVSSTWPALIDQETSERRPNAHASEGELPANHLSNPSGENSCLNLHMNDRSDVNPSRGIGAGRATITALCLGVDHYITGPMLRPFAPRLTELAVRELDFHSVCDAPPPPTTPQPSAPTQKTQKESRHPRKSRHQDKHHRSDKESRPSRAPKQRSSRDNETAIPADQAVFPLFPLLTSITVVSHAAQNFRRVLPFTPRLRHVICQRSVDAVEEATAPYTVTVIEKSRTGVRRRGHFDLV